LRKFTLRKDKKEEIKMGLDLKRMIIVGLLYIGYFTYLYVLLTHWELASGGHMFVGILQGVIPLSAIIFIGLVLSGEIKITIPIN
jgi:hypothetical protein